MNWIELVDWSNATVAAAIIGSIGAILAALIAVLGAVVLEIVKARLSSRAARSKSSSRPTPVAQSSMRQSIRIGKRLSIVVLVVIPCFVFSLGYATVLFKVQSKETKAILDSAEFERVRLESILAKLDATVNRQQPPPGPPRYEWVRMGRGDLWKRDVGAVQQVARSDGPAPAATACSGITDIDKVAVCPEDDQSVCHIKSATVQEILATDLNRWGSHPGGVFVCRQVHE